MFALQFELQKSPGMQLFLHLFWYYLRNLEQISKAVTHKREQNIEYLFFGIKPGKHLNIGASGVTNYKKNISLETLHSSLKNDHDEQAVARLGPWTYFKSCQNFRTKTCERKNMSYIIFPMGISRSRAFVSVGNK